MALLEVDQLITEFATDEGLVRAVDGVSFAVEAGATLGIVGESGCGKSVTALSMMRLLPQPMGRIAGGSITFQGTDLTRLDIPAMEKVRGRRIGMVFQEPMTALNPVHTIGRQLTEGMLLHKVCEPANALRAAADMLFYPLRLDLAPALDQQIAGIGVRHGDLFDLVGRDLHDGVDHRATDGKSSERHGWLRIRFAGLHTRRWRRWPAGRS